MSGTPNERGEIQEFSLSTRISGQQAVEWTKGYGFCDNSPEVDLKEKTGRARAGYRKATELADYVGEV